MKILYNRERNIYNNLFEVIHDSEKCSLSLEAYETNIVSKYKQIFIIMKFFAAIDF